MRQSIKITIPSYVNGFKCIGGDCEDSCCIGWDIDIDKLTYRKYFRTKDMNMKKEFVKHVYRNEDSQSDDVDYGRVRINESKYCPFLDDKKLCRIYSILGEDYLSNVCSSYPRVYNVLDGAYELSLFLSCPEAIRKLLASKEPISFIEEEMVLDKYIIHSCIDTSESRWNHSDVRQLKLLRQMSIEMIQDRKYLLSERLLRLGHELSIKGSTKSRPQNKSQVLDNPLFFQFDFFSKAIDSLHVTDEIDSPVFVSMTQKLQKGFKLKEKLPLAQKVPLYEKALCEAVEPFFIEKGYFLEHYLVNFMYQSHFPFTENQNILDGYVMLVVRYSFIRFYLSGMASSGVKIGDEDVVQLIQVFTKTIEHHKTFILDLLDKIKTSKYNPLEFAAALLKSH
ncbi:FliB family protein [Oceanispirochaeta crateris]|uniref:FliB family protein n=1 Tax=Oceanispirochaeta crateris TaxID=2518645 RepID=A0A5C1QLD1_9SPIO|nr:flagellin lysine-N-methylase [Oceanispirochaeta crateris]QEN08138.1 FliB family protein [Oceanispirochaeta crateris]